MKPSKAIEILELNIKEAGKKMPQDTLEAVKLGNEALKERAEAIRHGFPLWHQLLPGETPEGDSP